MGAQHSTHHKGGGIRLRRRAPTMGITTDEELQHAGVDIAHAVRLVEEKLSREQQAQQHADQGPSGTSELASGPGSPLHPAGTRTPGNASQRLHPSCAALQVELPPWEVIANLGESEWIAFRAWLEAGWRCKKCGNMRDDHGDHPKAIRLLCQCGVPIPGFKGAPNIPRPFCPSPSSSLTGTSRGVAVGYASESPDHQIGYLSDQSSRSQSSSRGASPLHPSMMGRAHTNSESPRFASEAAGSALSFPDRLHELQEHLQMKQQQSHGCPHQSTAQRTLSSTFSGSLSSSGHGETKYAFANEARPAVDGNLGPEACPHLASLGIHDASSLSSGSIGGSSSLRDPVESLIVPHVLKQQEEEIHIKDKILRAVARANQIYFVDKEPNGTLIFDYLLSALLDITNSPYGWISSALLKADGTPYLKTHAMSNVAWNKELRAWYAANAHKGLVFTNLNSLHGSIVYTGQPVITNNASQDPRSRGVPKGHPPIEKFFGIPLFTGSELIGIYGVANSPDGYTEQLQRTLEPLTLTIAQMMYAVNERKRRKEAEMQLSSVVQIAKEGIMSMSASGQITSINMAAREMFGLLPKAGYCGGQGPMATAGEDAAPPTDLLMQELIPEIDGRPNYLKRGLDPQEGHRHQGIGRRSDGTPFPVEVTIARSSYGTTFYVAVVRDLSKEVALRQSLEACTCGRTGDGKAQVQPSGEGEASA